MDEEDKIQAQIKSLLLARNYLLHQQPSDMVAIAHVTEMIVDLNARQTALSNALNIPPVSPQTVTALQSTISELDRAIQNSAAASQILEAATVLAKL
jgi:hypothetical protein